MRQRLAMTNLQKWLIGLYLMGAASGAILMEVLNEVFGCG
jgi:hypothetical protein